MSTTLRFRGMPGDIETVAHIDALVPESPLIVKRLAQALGFVHDPTRVRLRERSPRQPGAEQPLDVGPPGFELPERRLGRRVRDVQLAAGAPVPSQNRQRDLEGGAPQCGHVVVVGGTTAES